MAVKLTVEVLDHLESTNPLDGLIPPYYCMLLC